ncbi:MAG: ribonuclease III [Acidimicrobiia bacterium]|nr:ribonuclease III [Acidimicrobiia bacterium]
MTGHPLETALGHQFADSTHLELALTHSSHAAERNNVADNERLEFLGDAVLGLAVTTYLYETYPDLPEGELAKARAAAVDRDSLAEIAKRIDLSSHIRLGRGERSTGGRKKPSILADAMEALLGAVYLDAGYETASRIVLELWTDMIAKRATRPGLRDYKTRLQETLVAKGELPEYLVSGSGPDHARRFEAELRVGGERLGMGSGNSKKEAEQQAARAALNAIGNG